jgi:sporulation protein YlmC with PRC-barrel domain
MDGGRVVHAGLELLDRQLIDRDGRLCGKVDDLELSEPDRQGDIYLAALLSGPGALLSRMGHTRLGGWLRRFAAFAAPGEHGDLVRIPAARVSRIDNHITLALDRDELASFGGERWVRDNVIDHIPGSSTDATG